MISTGAMGDPEVMDKLEDEISQLKKSLAEARSTNQKLIAIINRNCYGFQPSGVGQDVGGYIDPEDGTVVPSSHVASPVDSDGTFLTSIWDRGSMLASLLLFQSFSSFILAHHEDLLKKHPTIVFYLTALVGAGGNAGNQAAVRIIRGIALGIVTDKNRNVFLKRELCMAFALSFLLGFVLILRTFISTVTFIETQTVLISIFAIVFLSVNLGALLPLLLQQVGIDPAHAGTIIQVVMDISGVLITCRISQFLMGINE